MAEKDRSDQPLVGEGRLAYVPLESIRRARAGVQDSYARAEVLADICRINALYMITLAGSGHIGSSFSAMDLVTWLWTEELTDPNSGEPHADAAALMARVNLTLEAWIRDRPEQWLWVHRRWPD